MSPNNTKPAAHTAGPWSIRTVIEENQTTGEVCERYDIDPYVAEIFYTNAAGLANARLIAAAPELLAALQECVTEDGANCLAYGTDTPKLRARIAKINSICRTAIIAARG